MDPENNGQDSDNEESTPQMVIGLQQLFALLQPAPRPVVQAIPDGQYKSCADSVYKKEEHAQLHFDEHVKKYQARLNEALYELQTAKRIAEKNDSVVVPANLLIPEEYTNIGQRFTEDEVAERQAFADFNYLMEEEMRKELLEEMGLGSMIHSNLDSSSDDELASEASSDNDDEVRSTKKVKPN